MTTPILAAQVLGISSAAFISGEIFTYGYAGAPIVRQSLKTSPKLAAQLWSQMFSIGMIIGPTMGTVATICFIYLRTQTGNDAYTLAAASTFSVVPWSMLVMQKTNNTIFDITSTEGKAEKDPAALDTAMRNWARLNYVRSSLPFIGALMGLKGVLS